MKDLMEWLRSLGLEQYHQLFLSNDIDVDVLPHLSEADFEKLGLTLGHRKRLLNALHADLARETGQEDHHAQASPDVTDEIKRVTVLFADLKGSTRLLANADAETAANVLQSCLTRMADAVHRYEGVVNQFMGDGLIALFGAPIAHEGHAVRACYAALAIQRELEKAGHDASGLPGALEARVGLHTGDVVVRRLANDISVQYDASGPAVALAKRLESMARPGSVLASGQTARLVEGYVATTPLGQQPVRGLHEPVEVFEVAAPETARSRLDAVAATRGLTRFVGRESELAALADALEEARNGRGQVICVFGEPGVGKSRLVSEFVGAVDEEDCLVLTSAARTYERTDSWGPLVGLLRAYFGAQDGDDQATVRDRVRARLESLPALTVDVTSPALSLLGVPSGESAWTGLSAPQRRRLTLDAVKRVLVAESQQQPLVVIFDDLHNMDDASLEFLNSLFESAPGSRILFIGTSRFGYEYPWTTRAFYSHVRLDPVSAAVGREILDHLLGSDDSLTALKTRLLEEAAGNPFYLEESVFSLAEAGKVVGKRGAYRLVDSLEQAPLPDSVQALVSARVDRLPPGSKQVLQCAAVIGKKIPFAVLGHVSGLDEETLRSRLSLLQARELLHETSLFPDLEYTLKHSITEEVAYHSLLREQRKLLHRRTGEAMEELYAERLQETAETVARHFERGEAWSKAAKYFVLAAERDKERFLYGGAAKLADAAVRAASAAEGAQRDALLVRALVTCGNIASLRGDLEGANAYYDRAIAAEADSARRVSIEKRKHIPSFVETSDGQIAYYEHGRGSETTILIVPALTYGLVPYQPLIERLCQDFRIITYDNLGTGRSDPMPAHYTADSQVQHAIAVIEASGASEVVCIGASRGGNVALKLAAGRPDLVAKVAPICSAPDDHVTGNRCPLPPEVEANLNAAVAEGDLEGCMRTWANMILNDPGTQDLIEGFVQRALATPEATWNFFAPNPELDLAPVLPSIQVPTLVMCGDRDLRVPLHVSRALARKIPNARIYIFERQGHLPAWTAPDEFCEVLRAFIAEGNIGRRASL